MDETIGRRIGLRRDEVEPPPPRESDPPPPFAGVNAYASDPILAACLDAALDEEGEEELAQFGAYWGSAEAEDVARIANRVRPELRCSDADGNAIDQLDVHPAYHALINRSVTAGLTAAAWEDGDDRRQHRLRAATLFLTAQCERSHLLTVSSTHAAVAALAYAPDLEAELFPPIASRIYDRRPLPLSQKAGILAALATCDAGNTDRADAARGELLGGDTMAVTGMKTFVAHPAADVLVTLVRTVEGPTAAVVPRYHQEPGAVSVPALRTPMGLAAAPFATMRFASANARVIGEPGRGRQVLRDVRTLTQLDAAIMAAGAMRSAVARAVHHACYHHSDGQRLIDSPLHLALLADIALESAAHTALTLRLATAFDRAFDSDGDHAIARAITPAARLATLKAAVGVIDEAAEIIGPNAIGTAHPMTRMRADIAALPAWEGPAERAVGELLHLVSRDPTVLMDALDEIAADLGRQGEAEAEELRGLGERAAEDPSVGRLLADRLATLAAASAMRRHLPRAVFDAFLATRLPAARRPFGALDRRFDPRAVLDFIAPEG